MTSCTAACLRPGTTRTKTRSRGPRVPGTPGTRGLTSRRRRAPWSRGSTARKTGTRRPSGRRAGVRPPARRPWCVRLGRSSRISARAGGRCGTGPRRVRRRLPARTADRPAPEDRRSLRCRLERPRGGHLRGLSPCRHPGTRAPTMAQRRAPARRTRPVRRPVALQPDLRAVPHRRTRRRVPVPRRTGGGVGQPLAAVGCSRASVTR